MYTDGITHAGKRIGQAMEPVTCLRALLEDNDPTPQEIADSLLEQAIHLDQGRPADDTSVVVLRVTSSEDDKIRRLSVRLPLEI